MSQNLVFARDTKQQSAGKEPKSGGLLGTDRRASWAVPVTIEYIQVAMSAALDAAKPASCRIRRAANSSYISSTAQRKVQFTAINISQNLPVLPPGASMRDTNLEIYIAQS